MLKIDKNVCRTIKLKRYFKKHPEIDRSYSLFKLNIKDYENKKNSKAKNWINRD